MESNAFEKPQAGTSAPPVSRTAYVTERIKEDLMNGVIAPGEGIKQTELAKRYGVSPTPVREALRILQADGLISYSPHKGASVRELAPDAAQDLYRLRAGAEQAAAMMGVERMTAQGLDNMRGFFEKMSALLEADEFDPSQFSRLNRSFHFALYEQCSPIIVQYLQILWSRFTPSSTVFYDKEAARQLHDEHRQILAAVENGEAEKAGDLTSKHILRAAAFRAENPEVRASGQEANI